MDLDRSKTVSSFYDLELFNDLERLISNSIKSSMPEIESKKRAPDIADPQ